MLVLTQLSAGAFLYLLADRGPAAKRRDRGTRSWPAISLGASTLHLGRPIYAWRALKMWRRSWLSREVLLVLLVCRRRR